MSDARQTRIFSPLPQRAMTDVRLTARHWRVLCAIAAHDRLGGNGAGCWASQQRLADLTSSGYSRTSDALADLREYGYLETEHHPKDRRRRVHRIVYDEARDRAAMKAARHSFPIGKQNTSANGKLSDEDTFPKTQNSFPKSRKFSAKPLTAQVENRPNICFRSIRSKNGEDGEANCAEAQTPEHGREAAEAADYLKSVEDMAASADPAERANLRFEIQMLAKMADNAALPETMCERAARLLKIGNVL
jgi:DNA-binding MarR family transcriptional regulator